MRLLSLAGCLLLTLPVIAYDDKNKANAIAADDEKKAYAWFDTLGFPDVSKCKLVRVATGGSSWGGFQYENKYLFAFLVNDDGNDFTVFTLDQETHTYTRTIDGTPESVRVGFEVADLKHAAEAALKCLQDPKKAGNALKPFGARFWQSKEIFVLARACAGHAHTELARKLLEQAERHQAANQGKDRPISVQQQVSDEIASEQLKLAMRAIGDPKVPRKELFVRFEAIVKNYPQGSHVQEEKNSRRSNDRLGRHAKPAREATDLLKQMVAEDATHAALPAKIELDMTKAEHIAELIFQLRDQEAGWWFSRDNVDIFRVFGPGGLEVETPARKLATLEYLAVPQLIAVLNDKRFSRAAGRRGKWDAEEYILRVGDCAYLILERIAGRRFSHSDTALADDNDKEAAARKSKVVAWWKEFQTKGEKRMLIEGVEAGDWDSSTQAARLMLRYSNEAFDAIAKGIRSAREVGPRSNLIIDLGGMIDIRVAPLLRSELKGPFLRSRVTAARTLQRMRYEDGVEAMIAEWRDRLTKKPDEEQCDELIEFLASCNRLEAVQALAADLRKRPVRERFHVIDAFDENRWDRLPWSNVVVLGAIERLLVEQLADTEAYADLTLGRDGKNVQGPRMCDVAGDVLSRFWNDPDSFDLFGSLKVRERQRVELQNAWRLPRGLPILPVPPREDLQ
jgi:hypothetical protein